MRHIFAANVTQFGVTQNTKILVEYKHTGILYIRKTNLGWKERSEPKKGYKKYTGYYFIDRIATPCITAKGEIDWWYDNNNTLKINKVSKYGKKIHEILSQNKVI